MPKKSAKPSHPISSSTTTPIPFTETSTSIDKRTSILVHCVERDFSTKAGTKLAAENPSMSLAHFAAEKAGNAKLGRFSVCEIMGTPHRIVTFYCGETKHEYQRRFDYEAFYVAMETLVGALTHAQGENGRDYHVQVDANSIQELGGHPYIVGTMVGSLFMGSPLKFALVDVCGEASKEVVQPEVTLDTSLNPDQSTSNPVTA